MKLKYELELHEILQRESKLNLKIEKSLELIQDYKDLDTFGIYCKNIVDIEIQESLLKLYKKQIDEMIDRKLSLLAMEYRDSR